ncbi:MAG: cytochrome c [Acetobacteraceae bacterium]|jgi:mono/diheme cytochrome c family protein
MIDWLTGILSTLLWPFSVRPSLVNLADPEMRRLVATALSELGLAVLLLAITTLVRRGRIVAILLTLPVVFTQVPSLALLLVPATPTSYHPSPTGFTASSIASGRAVFADTCVSCHGEAGDGVGGRGEIADLRAPHIWSHPAGDLFWFVSHGINQPDGTYLMPAFQTLLPDRTRWSLIDYVHALNAGAVARGLGGWPGRVPAPSAAISCTKIAARSIADLRGKAVRIILGALPVPLTLLPPVNGIAVVTVWIPGAATEAAPAAGVDCVAQGSSDAATAYAILAGSADGKLIPARFLVDPEGVLRSVWRKGDGDDWADPNRQLQEVRTICTEAFSIGPGDEHEHHH